MFKGLSSVALLVTLLIVLVLGSAYVYYSQDQENGIVCPQDANMCPDGSYVGRTGPQCEFATCPGEGSENTPVRTEKNAVSAIDQIPGGTVTVAMVTLEQEGWVVVHDERNNQVGTIIAARRVNAGITENVVVDLLGAQTQTGRNYYALLYNDDGDRKFDFKKDFPLKDASGAMIAIKFMIENEVSADISSWKTYSNNEFGFSFDYPAEWTQGSFSFQDPAPAPTKLSLRFGDSKNQFRFIIVQVFDKNNAPVFETSDSQVITFQGGTGIRYDSNALINKDSIIINLIYSHELKDAEIFDTILSTFKFTK